jgi:hypothetical protein
MGRYLGRCVVCASGALALCLVFVQMTGTGQVARAAPASARTEAQQAVAPTLPATRQKASANGTSLLTTARTLEPYLVRQANGTLSLTAPASVVNRLPAPDVQALASGLNALNASIAAGELRTTPAGAVFNPTTDRLMLQGNWSGFGQDWWHAYLCLSHNDVIRMTNFGWWSMSAAGIAALSAFSSVLAAAIGTVVALYGGWMYLADHGSGSCLNFGHWPPPNMWVTSQ